MEKDGVRGRFVSDGGSDRCGRDHPFLMDALHFPKEQGRADVDTDSVDSRGTDS